MKRFATLCLIGMLTGCAVDPPELPTWSDVDKTTPRAEYPAELPDLVPSPDDGSPTAQSLAEVLTVCRANTELATELADAVVDRTVASNSLIDACKHQRDYARIREEQLAIQRRQHRLDNWFHRAIIVLLGAGLAL